jgi:hypothetical protein
MKRSLVGKYTMVYIKYVYYLGVVQAAGCCRTTPMVVLVTTPLVASLLAYKSYRPKGEEE